MPSLNDAVVGDSCRVAVISRLVLLIRRQRLTTIINIGLGSTSTPRKTESVAVVASSVPSLNDADVGDRVTVISRLVLVVDPPSTVGRAARNKGRVHGTHGLDDRMKGGCWAGTQGDRVNL